MVKSIEQVAKRIATQRYVAIDIDPFSSSGATELHISVVKDDGEIGTFTCRVTDKTLMVITDEDLQNYIVAQIDRFTAGLPLQKPRIEVVNTNVQ